MLSDNQLDEFPAETDVWMLLNGDYHDTYLRYPTGSRREPEILGFMEKEDAERMVQLLKRLDKFKAAKITVGAQMLTEVRNSARLSDEYVYVLSHELALKFFDDYSLIEEE